MAHSWRSWAVEHGLHRHLYRARGHAALFDAVERDDDVALLEYLKTLEPRSQAEGAQIIARLLEQRARVEFEPGEIEAAGGRVETEPEPASTCARVHVNRAPVATRNLIYAAAWDAGNRAMVRNGRKAWTEEEWNAASAEFARLAPLAEAAI